MTIKALKEKYKNYACKNGEYNTFTCYDYKDGRGQIFIVVNNCKGYGKTVMQAIRKDTGEELLKNGSCRPCDNLDDAIDVLGEMI